MASNEARIEISLAVDPNTHRYSSSTAPDLVITATYRPSSTCDRPKDPITIFASNTVFDREMPLYRKLFQVTDVTKSHPKIVDQRAIMLQHGGGIRRRQSRAEYFVTLEPGIPGKLSWRFAYPEETGPPLPWGSPDRITQRGNDKAQRSGVGVDGLEVDHNYRVEAVNGLKVSWWRYGTKDEVLDADGPGDMGSPDGDAIKVVGGEHGMAADFDIVA